MSPARAAAFDEPDRSPHVLREYALVADGERGALIGPRGDIAWMCAPRWDSDAVFSTLVGGSGTFRVAPTGRFVWGGYYEDRSLIWRSRWITDTGIVECREALAYPGDPHRAVLLRRIIAVRGDAEVDLEVAPAAGFGRHRLAARRVGDGCWAGRLGELRCRLAGDPETVDALRADPAGRLVATVTIPAGGHRDLILELSDQELPGEAPAAGPSWAATESGWSHAVPELGDTLTPRDARHSYAVLRGLTSSGGGMVAAATLGLPERAEQRRNYDYRYVWVRDQCYAGLAAAAAGAPDLLDEAVRFVGDRLLGDGPELAPAYTVAGGRVPDERRLDLPGYPGGQDIAGNHANAQFQLDAFGESLLLLAAAARQDRLDTGRHRAIEIAVEAIDTRWSDPDAGIWELEARRWTHSRLTCVAGLRAVAAEVGGRDAGRWSGLADAILADTTGAGLHPDGHWQRAPDDPGVDAALLLPPIRGALPASDPRTRATLAAVEHQLAEDGYLYRFRHDPRPLGEAEGAFLLCGFLMALARHQQGDRVAAARWFERNRAACGPPGLFTEEFDVTERQLRGNLPQAFVHALLLESSARLAGS